MATPSPEKDNFVRIAALLIDGGAKLMRGILDSIHNTPASLSAALAVPKTEKELKKARLSLEERNKLYPPAGGQVKSEDLDITLLSKVLRHACSPPLPTPTAGWNTPPSAADQSPSDDLVRIRIHRNEAIAHATEMKLDAAEFEWIWNEISAAMIRLAKQISTAEETKWKALVEEYRSGPVTCEEEEYVKDLEFWYERDRLLEEEIRAGFQTLSGEISSVKELIAIRQEERDIASLDGSGTSDKVKIGDIEFQKNDCSLLGEGCQGTKVYKGKLSSSSLDVAVKKMYRGNFDASEAKKLRSLEHSSIIRCFALEEDEDHFYLGLELCQKTLTLCVKENDFQRRESGLDKLECLKQVTSALVYLHDHNICHRDIKPDNILLACSSPQRFVLADFNIAKHEGSVAPWAVNPVGSTGYIAHEISKGDTRSPAKADVFSLGCVLYFTLTKMGHPFGSYKDLEKCQFNINHAKKPEFQENDINRELLWIVKITERMTKHDPSERPDAEKVLQSLESGLPLESPEPEQAVPIPSEMERVVGDDYIFLGNEDKLGTQDLNLRGYQKELAEAALQGKDSIICAPTNSGKTYVAVHITKEHLGAEAIRDSEGASASKGQTMRSRKVAFIVNTVNLVAQQKERFEIFLGKQYRVSDMSGEKSNEMPFKDLLQDNDIVVMTAQILVNALKGNRVALSDISLLIFDECHHAQKEHPYNSVMEQYITLRLQQGSQHELPQVVGLTASLGVGDTNDISKAVENILQICANLDVENVSTVREHKEELSKYANTPERKVFVVSTRGQDVFLDFIGQVMGGIEKELRQVKPPPPRDRRSQAYRQWLEELYKRAVVGTDRSMVTYVDQLRVYHVSLEVNSTLRMKDAMTCLEKYFGELDEDKFTAVEKKLKERYNRAKKALEEYIRENGEPENPNLKQLEELISGGEANGSRNADDAAPYGDSKGIVFTATRESTQALSAWIENNKSLNKFLRPATIVGGGDSESGMTRCQQENAIKMFKDGEVNILLATNVAEEGLDISDCDYVIRYNIMGNEISSVQSRGRVRAKEGGKFFIVAKQESGVLKREKLNNYRELLMAEAVDRVQKMDIEDFKRTVKYIQKQALDGRHLKREAREKRQLEFQPGDVTFYCKKCKERTCQAHHLRSIGTYRVIRPDILQDKVSIKPHPKRGKFLGTVEYISKVHCGKCDEDWGVEVVINARKWISFKVKSFLLEYSDGSKDTHKQWKDVRFKVAEFNAGEDEEDKAQTD